MERNPIFAMDLPWRVVIEVIQSPRVYNEASQQVKRPQRGRYTVGVVRQSVGRRECRSARHSSLVDDGVRVVCTILIHLIIKGTAVAAEMATSDDTGCTRHVGVCTLGSGWLHAS